MEVMTAIITPLPISSGGPWKTSGTRVLGATVCHRLCHCVMWRLQLAGEWCPSTSYVHTVRNPTWLPADPCLPRWNVTPTINIDFIARRFPATIGVPSDRRLVQSNRDRNQENHLPDSLNALQPSPMGRGQR